MAQKLIVHIEQQRFFIIKLGKEPNNQETGEREKKNLVSVMSNLSEIVVLLPCVKVIQQIRTNLPTKRPCLQEETEM